MKRMEFRIKDVQLDHTEDRKIGGYVNVTERESETLYSQQRGKWFKEVMKKGVFERALAKNQSIPCLLEHNWDKELAHTSKGTLELREDNIGLRFDAIITDDEVYEQIRSGAINSCSFGFTVEEQDFENVNSRFEKRYVHEINLKEISLVKNPAYVGSLVESRNLEMALREDEEMNKVEETVVEEVVETTDVPVVEEVVEETIETTEERAEETIDAVEETTEEVVEEEVEVVEDAKEEVTDEERNVETVIEETNADNQVINEVIEDAIEQKECEIAMHEDMAEYTEEYAKELEDRAEELRRESILHEIQSLKCRTDLLRLKQVKNRL